MTTYLKATLFVSESKRFRNLHERNYPRLHLPSVRYGQCFYRRIHRAEDPYVYNSYTMRRVLRFTILDQSILANSHIDVDYLWAAANGYEFTTEFVH